MTAMPLIVEHIDGVDWVTLNRPDSLNALDDQMIDALNQYFGDLARNTRTRIVVLKGAGTIIVAPDGTLRVIDAGNPGMAVGGMGDVLTGVIAALRAQGLSAFDAASTGALLHALAGDAAAWDGQRGLLPSDLMPHLRRLANP